MEQQRGKVVTKFGMYQQPSMSGSFAHLSLGSLTVSSLTAYNQVIKQTTTVDELQSIQSISANSITSITVSAISVSAGSITLPLSGVLVSDGIAISAIPWTNYNEFLRGDGVFAPAGSGATANYDAQIAALSSTVTGHTVQIAALSAALTSATSSHAAVTLGTANGLSLSGQILSMALASSSTTGTLSNADWNTFNNKQDSFDLAGLSSTVTGHTNQISSLSSSVTSLQSATGTLTSQINSLSSTVTGIEINISSLSSSITSLETATGTLTSQISSLSSSITSLESATGALDNSKVPYTGATANVNLGAYSITAERFYALSSTPIASNELASKTYVDSLTTSPIVNSSTKGFTWFAI